MSLIGPLLSTWAVVERVFHLVVEVVKIEIDRAPKPILIEVPTLWALDRDVFYGRSHSTPDAPDER